jgi:hypothetical protein
VFQQQLEAFLKEIDFEWSDEAKTRWARGESSAKGSGGKASSDPFDKARCASARIVVAQVEEDVFGRYLRKAIERVFEESKRAPMNEAPSANDRRALYQLVAEQIWPDAEVGREELEAVMDRVAAFLQPPA